VAKLGGDDDDEDDETEPDLGSAELARNVFDKGYKDLKARGIKKGRARLLEAWKDFEVEHGTSDDVAKVQAMMPYPANRPHTEDDSGWDYIFPDDERDANPTSFKFLQMAHAWKIAQAKAAAGPGEGQDEPSAGGDDSPDEAPSDED